MPNSDKPFDYLEATNAFLGTDNKERLEQFPDQLLFEFSDTHDPIEPPTSRLYVHEAIPHAFSSGVISYYHKPQGFSLGQQLGWHQTDQSYENDGYRFRYAFSIAGMAITGWSAVMRNLLSLRRRSLSEVERIEDGPRAMHAEEYLFAKFGKAAEDSNEASILEDNIVRFAAEAVKKELSCFLPPQREVGVASWTRALTVGYKLWSLTRNSIGVVTPDITQRTAKSAFIHVNRTTQEIRFSAKDSKLAKLATPISLSSKE